MPSDKTRAANWDLLRSIAMFLVVFVHSVGTLTASENLPGVNSSTLIAFAIICDPIFFILSGYFAIKPSTRSLKNYYLNKISTIILPLFLYAILVYLYRTRFVDISLEGYLSLFAKLIVGDWWFIPALIPCLVVAPFISKGLENLTDKQVIALSLVVFFLFFLGLAETFLIWMANTLEIKSLAGFVNMLKNLVPPGILIQGPAYFQFFLMGGLYRRLAPLINKKHAFAIVAIGLLAWIVDMIFATYQITRTDPSYLWMFTAFGAMVLFGFIRIKSKAACSIISWVGKRSYSIYLMQYTTISISSSLIYGHEFFGVIYNMEPIAQVAFWIVFLLFAYLLALLIASIVDPLILSNCQKLFNRLFMKPNTQKNKAKLEQENKAKS